MMVPSAQNLSDSLPTELSLKYLSLQQTQLPNHSFQLPCTFTTTLLFSCYRYPLEQQLSTNWTSRTNSGPRTTRWRPLPYNAPIFLFLFFKTHSLLGPSQMLLLYNLLLMFLVKIFASLNSHNRLCFFLPFLIHSTFYYSYLSTN